MYLDGVLPGFDAEEEPRSPSQASWAKFVFRQDKAMLVEQPRRSIMIPAEFYPVPHLIALRGVPSDTPPGLDECPAGN